MLVNGDFGKRAIVTPSQYRWVPSPQEGVERMMLDRLGGEDARATSIVRYAPGSHFPAHFHPAGEEILVLAGTFSEDGHDYRAGSYLRSPPGSSHRPSSADGTTLFVKVRQMTRDETGYVRLDTRDRSHWATRDGRHVCRLFEDSAERVSLEQAGAGERVFTRAIHFAEILVTDGQLCEGDQRYVAGSWLRLPAGDYPEIVCGASGATFYLKTRTN